MDIEEYVREALLSITKGIASAQADADVGQRIGHSGILKDNSTLMRDRNDNMVTAVEFDLATTVEEATTAGGKVTAGIKILSANAGVEGKSSSSSVSRVRFSVPVVIVAPNQRHSAMKIAAPPFGAV